MMTASSAPAAMPSEEDVARVLCEARHQMLVSPDQWAAEMAHIREIEGKHPTYITGFSTGTDAVRQARAILDLFAPILAGKEREIATFERREAEWNEAIANSLQNEEDAHRKLEAAEAGLAAVEGKIAKALPEIVPAVEDWLFNGASDQDAAKTIAAAIRAQGE